MENNIYLKKSKVRCLHCKSPLLFSIPLNVYSDEIEKERDKESFLRIKSISIKCEQLKQKVHSYAEQHSIRIAVTRNIILQTLEVNNNFRGKKTN